jgi:flavin-dependent dehydrogenase
MYAPSQQPHHSTPTDYDVIIIGGRPAGSTLAARLGQANIRTLLLERATMPSLPAVSAPGIYASTMKLLDEIGADEAQYARNTPKLRRIISEVGDHLKLVSPIPDANGRDYLYAIDRARFDEALWRNAARFPSVTVMEGVGVTDLLWEDGRVAGVRSKDADGVVVSFTAKAVIGADGRFSLVARKVNAEEKHVQDQYVNSILYAYFKNTEAYDSEGSAVYVHGNGKGAVTLMMDSADGSLCVAVGAPAAMMEQSGDGMASAEQHFYTLLRREPRVWRRLMKAERITKVSGMKRMGNLYRQAGGPGWALVGDALHQKDPLDGQGIYDAVYTAKALATQIIAWQQGSKAWEVAISDYEADVMAETYPMYRKTMERVEKEMHTIQPTWVYKTLLRWLATYPAYAEGNAKVLARVIPAQEWNPKAFLPKAILRGIAHDVIAILRRRPLPGTPAPLPLDLRQTVTGPTLEPVRQG